MIIHHEVPTDKKYGTLIFLQKPMKRIVCETKFGQQDFERSTTHLPEYRYFISLPHVLFGINYFHYNNKLIPFRLSLGFATNDKLEQIYIPTFNNIGYRNVPVIGSRVCLRLYFNTENPDDLAKKVVNAFWIQRFNYEATRCMDKQRLENPYSPLNSLEKWAKKTKQDPNWIPTENDMTPMSSYQVFKDFTNKTQEL